MKPSLLLLTNPNNESPEEDLWLQQYLSEHFSVTPCHPLECEETEDAADIILIRNIWLTSQYESKWEKIRNRFLKKKLLTYNPLVGKGDTQVKDYLIELFQQGYPVIPTIDSLQEIKQLGDTEDFMIKPKNGGSSLGVERVTKRELVTRHWNNSIVQPYTNFTYELSFYFINNQFQHALYAPDKTKRWDLVEFQLSSSDLAFAERFVQWNTLPYGIQRIDACRLPGGQLLLMEIEDLCPYLSLQEISEQVRSNFLNNLVLSLQKLFRS